MSGEEGPGDAAVDMAFEAESEEKDEGSEAAAREWFALFSPIATRIHHPSPAPPVNEATRSG
jgi:hypothetical protein